jgi:glycosyltransferase involved in cell wall biosynthesis
MAGSDPVVYTFLPTATALRLTELVRGQGSVVVYHCVSDFPALAEKPDELLASERALVKHSDLVIVQSEGLATRFAGEHPRVHQLGIGVNMRVFDPAEVRDVPKELRELPRPLIGYIGALHRYLDLNLLRDVARAFPGGSVVLVGPAQVDPASLRGEPNVHLLGGRAHPELPAFVAAFDVGLIPYERSVFTETVNPTKLYEYLAMGTPVVSTDLPEVVSLKLPSFAVRTSSNSDEFVGLVKDALASGDAGDRSKRRALALQRDWHTVIERIAELITDRRAKRPH